MYCIVVTVYNRIEWDNMDNCKYVGNGSKYGLLNDVNGVYQKAYTM